MASQEPTSIRTQGRVKWFDTTKGFGFIRISEDENEKDIFVHQSTIHAEGFRSLGEGEIVEFDLVTDPKGQHAENVTGPNGSFVVGAARPPPRKMYVDQRYAPVMGYPYPGGYPDVGGYPDPRFNPQNQPMQYASYVPQYHQAVYHSYVPMGVPNGYVPQIQSPSSMPVMAPQNMNFQNQPNSSNQ